ncbi:MAG: putative transposase [Zhongshania sp.]|jgi:putative transposase
MARMPRLVVPNYPHHVTQRGVRSMQTFFTDDDYRYYLNLVRCYKDDAGVSIWAYCLMPNHVHFVAVPEEEDSLARLFRRVHLAYTRAINTREQWQGHLWQERFHSFVMDEEYLLATVRYVELNPVKAKLCTSVEMWPWSSANAHIQACDDHVVTVGPMLERVKHWQQYLAQENAKISASIKQFTTTGRPAGEKSFVSTLEVLTGRELQKKSPGPKPRVK